MLGTSSTTHALGLLKGEREGVKAGGMVEREKKVESTVNVLGVNGVNEKTYE